jgi:adenylate cyclase
MRRLLTRAISVADDPGDDDDLRLRKRVAVFASYATMAAALILPLVGDFRPITFLGASSLPSVNAINLVALSRTHQFDRYVVVAIGAGFAYTIFADVAEGGLEASGACVVWAFLGPVFAILFLGPRRALPWFGLFLVVVLVILLIDPLVSVNPPPAPYWVRLTYWAENICIPAAIIFLLVRYTDMRRLDAQAISEELLTNAIPRSIAARLKHGEQRIAEAYPETTVLFSDIVGFTPWAQQTDPDRVVDLLDGLFTRFDELAAEHGVEKIKTVGDSYMAVAGAPEKRQDHAEAALAMAHGMLDATAAWRSANALELEVRIGLASGKVVAGVIGQKRILFDLWGDTVNLASRMESSGLPGRIQVAPSTWALLREHHIFDAREPMEIKGLGPMTTYLLADV